MQWTPKSVPQLRCSKRARIRPPLISRLAESMGSRMSSGMALGEANRSPAIGKATALTAPFCSLFGIVLMSLSTRCETIALFPLCCSRCSIYLRILQQILQAFVVSIADTYTTTDKVQWQNTAANFRLPFWDWASNSVPPDQVISQQTVDIIVADGSTQTFTNPLYSYPFNPVSDGGFSYPWNQWNTTLRCPTDDTPNAQTDVQQLIR
jgi:hypothetical protein